MGNAAYPYLAGRAGHPAPSMLLYRRGELPEKRQLAESWGRHAVLDILTNPAYTGNHTARRWESYKTKVRQADGRLKTKTRKRLRTDTDPRRVGVTIPALITMEQWEKVQGLVKGRKLGESEMDDAPLLNRGFAVCGLCGTRIIATKHPTSGYRMYQCGNRRGVQTDPAKVCPGGHFAVRASEVDEDVWTRTKAIIQDGSRFQRLTQGKAAKLAERHQEAVQRAGTVARELAEMQEKQAVVFRRMNDERDDTIAAMYRQELQHLNETVRQLEVRVEDPRRL